MSGGSGGGMRRLDLQVHSLSLSSPLSSLFSNTALTPASVHSTAPVLTLII